MHCHICTMIAFEQLFVEIYQARMDCQIQSMKPVLLILELPSSLCQTHPIGQNLQARMDILRQARTLFKLVKYTSKSLLDYKLKNKSNFLFVFPFRAYIHTESCKKVWHVWFWIVSIGSDEGKASKTFYFSICSSSSNFVIAPHEILDSRFQPHHTMFGVNCYQSWKSLFHIQMSPKSGPTLEKVSHLLQTLTQDSCVLQSGYFLKAII